MFSGNVGVANERTAVNNLFASVDDPVRLTRSDSPRRKLQARLENAMIDANSNPEFLPIEAVPVQLREATGQHGRKPSS